MMSHSKDERAVFTHEMNVADGTLGLENHDWSEKIRFENFGPKINELKISNRKS